MTSKFLKFTYMYMIGALSFTPICSCSHSHNISLSGGSVSLSGKPKTKGEDSKQWKLTIDGEVVDKNAIEWKLTPESGKTLPDTISISDGIVFWTDQIEAGTYNFYVSAIYDNNEINSKIITLLIKSSYIYYLSGGSNALNGFENNAGQDENAWKLYLDDYEITHDIAWKLTPESGKTLPDTISINDGIVSWTDQIKAGTYNFYVSAIYDNNEINSKIITLLVTSSHVHGFKDNKISYYNPFYKKNIDVELSIDNNNGFITYNATPLDVSVLGTTPEQNLIMFEPIFDESSTMYISKRIKYELIFDDSSATTYTQSIFIYYENEWLFQNEKPLTFFASAPIYDKAKIKVTFECDSDVSLVIPINAWFNETSVSDKFEIPSEKQQEYVDKIIINFDEGLNTYNCYLHSSDVDKIKNILPFDICSTSPAGYFSLANFEINNIEKEVLVDDSCKITFEKVITPKDEIVNESNDEIISTAIISYNIHVDFSLNGKMPIDENYKHSLFEIIKTDSTISSMVSKCNLIWYFNQ